MTLLRNLCLSTGASGHMQEQELGKKGLSSLKKSSAGPHPRVADSSALVQPRICTCSKFPGDDDDAGPGATL